MAPSLASGFNTGKFCKSALLIIVSLPPPRAALLHASPPAPAAGKASILYSGGTTRVPASIDRGFTGRRQ